MPKNTLAYFFLLLLLQITIFSFSQDLTKLINENQTAVVSIICYDEDNEILSYGSGFFIDKNVIITNRHVLENASFAKIETFDNHFFNITHILNEDIFSDIVKAEVNIKNYSAKSVKISNKKPVLGESIFVIGNPLGLGQTVSTGIVSGFRKLPDIGNFIQITAPISPGSSGSPVLNMSGEVIGVVTLQLTEGQNYNLSVPISVVSNFGRFDRMTLTDWGNKNYEDFLSSDESLLLYGIFSLSIEEYDEALKAFYALPSEMKELSEFHFIIGFCYFELEKYSKAVDAFKKSLSIDNTNYETLLYLGKLYYFLEEYETSVNYLLEALNLNDYNYEIYSFLGLNLLFLEEYELALNGFDLAIDLNDSDAFLYIMRASLRNILNDPDGSYLDYQKAYELDPILIEELDLFEVDEFVQNNKQNDHYYYFQKGLEDFNRNDFNSAYSFFSKAIDIEKNNSEYYYYRGISKYELTEYSSAILDLNLAIKLNPVESNYYFYRGKVKHMLKNYSGACSDWIIAKKYGHELAGIFINQYCE
jgi:tetratricopeptide (TPR) repeat protein